PGGAMPTATRRVRTRATGSSHHARPLPDHPPPRVRILRTTPAGEGGYPVKRTVGERLAVTAEVLHDGHVAVGAALRWKSPGASRWSEVPMRPVGDGPVPDRWEAEI